MAFKDAVSFGDFQIDLPRGELRREGVVVPVEPQVLDLIAHLAAHAGEIVTRDELIAAVWGGRIVSDSAIASRINAARAALGDDGTLWTSTSDVHPGAPHGMFTGDGMFTGLASYDGERWTTVEVDEPVPGHALRMAVAPDGTVWVALRGPEDWTKLAVVKWDGATWDTFGPVDDRSWQGSSEIHFAPDGTVWFGATTFYDGSDFRRVEIPTSITDGELRVGSHAFGPDGSLWVVFIDMRDPESLGCEVNPDVCEGVSSLYVITPEAVQ